MHTMELERIQKLHHQLDRLGLNPEGMLEGGYDGVAVHASSTLIYANARGSEMFGYTQQEIEGLNAWTLFDPESGPILLDHLRRRSQSPYRVIGRRKDGSRFPVELKGADFELDGEEFRLVLMRQLSDTEALTSSG